MPIHPDSALEPTVAALASRLLVEENEDFPVSQPGFVRTLLFPCFHYKLPENRLFALRDMMVKRGSRRFFVKLQQQPGWHYVYNGTAPDPHPFGSTDALHRFQAEVKGGGEIPGFDRVPTDLWFEGDWHRDVDDATGAIDMGEHHLLEHMILDERGNWVLLVSDEDVAYLVADLPTSREMLAMWGTSQQDELSAYEVDITEPGHDEYAVRILEHARARKWS
jgi:hypothetical protein